ncbi:MAG: ABC transporter, partial [Meiothermus sp.]
LAQRRRTSAARSKEELAELAARGWVAGRGGRWELTEQGDAEAHRLEQAMRVLPKALNPRAEGGTGGAA